MEGKSLPPAYLAADNGWKVTTVAIVLIALQLFAVIARFSARRMQKAPLLADDYWIVPALVRCKCPGWPSCTDVYHRSVGWPFAFYLSVVSQTTEVHQIP